MSVVKLDLRLSSQSPQQQSYASLQPQQQPQSLSPSAPLVKINLSPENAYISENNQCSQGQCSCCPTSNNHSTQVTNLTITTGSPSSITARLSPQQKSCTNLAANQMASPAIPTANTTNTNSTNTIAHLLIGNSSMSSPHKQTYSGLNKSQQQHQQQSNEDLHSISPTHPHYRQDYSKLLLHHPASNVNEDNLLRMSVKQEKAPRKVSTTLGELHLQNTTTTSITNNNNNTTTTTASLENTIEILSKKLEKSSLENIELKDTLLKEKSRSQMILTENLTIKEELKKAYLRLKELESLQNMRQSQNQAIHSQRSSWLRSSPLKKPIGYAPQKISNCLRRPSTGTHQHQRQSQQLLQQQQQQQQQQFDNSCNNNNNHHNCDTNDEDIFDDHHQGREQGNEGSSFHGDYYCQEQLLEQNQSSLSILDILHNLNGKDDPNRESNSNNILPYDQGNASFSAGTTTKKKTQNRNGLKVTSATNQSRRRTDIAPAAQYSSQSQATHASSSSSNAMVKKAFN